MKLIKLTLLGLLVSFTIITGCQRDAHQDITSNKNQPAANNGTGVNTNSEVSGKEDGSGPCNPNAYTVILESRTLLANGNWEWIWSVQNPNPGNGSNGTVQNLSHWGMQLNACFNLGSMVTAAYSADGNNWTYFTPVYQTDPSQACMTTPVLKFDFGTEGSNKSYYKLVVRNYYPIGSGPAYYKSGVTTGCCTFYFSGIGCEGDGGGPRKGITH
jgi:hypothetical protein